MKNYGLTKNDKCFFALSFYRQAMQDMFFNMDDSIKAERYRSQANYWWSEYKERRQLSQRSGIRANTNVNHV